MRLSIAFTCLLCLTGLKLHGQCMAGFTFVDNGLMVHFSDASMGGGSPIVSWSWDFGDGSTSNLQNPMHTFPDAEDYLVCLNITTQSGCANQSCFVIDICTLLIAASVNPNCDPNGEITVNITISDPLDQAKAINVTVDGVLVPGSPFDIDDDAPVVIALMIPGDGLSHTITAQSEDIGHCNAQFVFTAPDCNSNCFLSALNIQFAGGMIHAVNVGNDFFAPASLTLQAGDIVRWTWSGSGHSTTSDATTGPDSWNSGVLGQGSIYERIIYNPGLHPYYCIPHGGPGGAGMSATLVANCPTGNNFTLNISFNTTLANPQGYNVLLDGILQPGSPFQYSGTGQNTATLPLVGDGQAHTIEIRDVADPTCLLMGQVNAPDCGAAPICMLGVTTSVVSGCDVANMVDVALEVTSINGGTGGFRVRIDGSIVIPQVDYHPSGTTTVNVPVTGDGGSHQVIVEDISDNICSAGTSLITENCMIPCMLNVLILSTGTSTTHTVQVQDFQFVPQHITIASGDLVEFSWTGEVQHTSTSDADVGPDSWDSGLLGFGASYFTPVLSEGVHPYYCIPHGGPGGVGMSGTIIVAADCTNGEVAVNVSFAESGGGFNGYNILIDGNIASGSPYTYTPGGQNAATIFVTGDGQSHQISIQDIDNPLCAISASIVTSNCNASLCQLNMTASLAGDCDANQMIPVEVIVSSLNGGVSGFRILIDGIVSSDSPYDYDLSGATVVSLILPGDGAQHIVVVEDIEDPLCNAGTNLILPDCNLSCQIFDLEVLPAMATTHQVEVQDFAFFPQHITASLGDTVHFIWTGSVAHTTTSDATTGPDSWDSGLQTNGATYNVIISEAGIHPYYCIPHGGPGGIGMSGTITTLADCENGFVNVHLSFQQSGGSLSGFFIVVDGDTINQVPIAYELNGTTTANVLVIGDGLIHAVQILDAANNGCGASVNIITADCNAVPCSLSVDATVTGGCTQSGLVPVEVVVTSVGGSAEGFNVFADGIIVPGSPFVYDPSGMTTFDIFLPGNNAMHQIFIHDIGDVSCTAIIPIETPDCTGQCQLDNFSIAFAQSTMHIVEVRDFEFFPKNLNIILGDTVRFVWAGQIAHTSTSDATVGTDSWDSGLLGNGAVFDLVLTTSGTHPYYCIPHGGPGGVGMSGSITAAEICATGMLSTRICFQAANGSFGGYEILIGGIVNGPYAYSGAGMQCVLLDVAGDGQLHPVSITDVETGICSLDTILLFPDCNDPCFGFTANFGYTYDPQTLEVNFINESSSNATVFNWLFGDGSTSMLENPMHIYDSAQQYDVCLIVSESGGCVDTSCVSVPLGIFICEPAFMVSVDGLTITVMDTSVTSAPVESRIWSFGNGQIAFDLPTVIHTYPSLGVYDLCLSIQADTCMQTVCQTLNLSNPCLITNAAFEYTVSETTTVQFTDRSSGQITSRLWGFGDGNTSTESNPVHEYAIPGTYTVCLLIFDTQHDCSEFFCREIQVQTTGVHDFTGVRPLILFPNPATTNDLSISLLGIAESDIGKAGRLSVYAMHGGLIVTNDINCEEKILFEIQKNVPDGIFFIELSTDRNVYTGKLMIQD